MFNKFFTATNKVIKKLKTHLVKKVELKKHYKQSNFLTFEFDLVNYFLIHKPIQIEFVAQEEIYPIDNYKLIKNNELKIYVPISLIEKIESNALIKLIINDKPVWITQSDEYEDYNESLLLGNNFISTSVNKNIRLNNKFKEITFVNEWINASITFKSYSNMEITFEQPLPDFGEQDVEVYLFNNKRFSIIEAFYDPSTQSIIFNDLFSITAGLWRLFVNINDQLFPLELTDKNPGIFNTYLHQIEILNKNDVFYLEARPHSLETDFIRIEKLSPESFKLDIEADLNLKEDENLLLYIEEPRSGFTYQYPLKKIEGETFTTTIPTSELCESHFVKRFFVIKQSKEPRIIKFNLNKHSLSNTNFTIIDDSQHKKIKFYRRKDHSLGMTVSRPVLKKSISAINEFVLEGHIGSLELFDDCKAYLLLEERESLKSIKVPISNNFSISLLDVDLIDLKTKDKTIIDFFVVIENEDKQFVRKEKIRYEDSVYKKDNYFGYKILNDLNQNQHHFLITITPYHNLKLESFTIPNHIHIPEDTKVKDKKVWLIGERYNTAQDNGIVLFNWLQKHTHIDAYYVIEENSEDYLQIKDNPKVLTFGSPKHYEIAFKAKVLLGTHDLENILPYKPARGFFGYENTCKIFLQHGVLGRKNVEYHKKYYDDPFDLFIVSSIPEKEDIVMDEMGYDEDEVVVTGLARFDNLIHKEKPRDILLMPTWRDWINTDQQFLESEYYLAYSNLIKNEKLISLLNEYDVNLNFYPHYRAQEFFQNDIAQLDERIKFIPLGSDTVQNLLINHALLITDYSSVSFDFTLLNKPVIYYHFDVKRFFRRGILRPVEETFIGGIASSEDELVTLIEDRIKNNFSNFDHDISGIIKYQDHKNCARTYEAIQKLLEY